METIETEIKGYKTHLQKLERSKANLERDIDNITDEDKNAGRKRQDTNNRLNRIYDEIYDIEDQIADCEQRRLAAAQKDTALESILKMLENFDECFSKMDKEDQREVIASLISEIQLHPKETWQEGQNPVKKITYTFPLTTTGVVENLGGKYVIRLDVALLLRLCYYCCIQRNRGL